MAQVLKRRVLVNPARKRRLMSPKQIKFFGTARQRTALKKRTSTARRAQPNGSGARRTRRARKNFGEIVTIGLANPGTIKKGNSMAKTRRKVTATSSARRRRQSNPGKRRTRRANPPTITSRKRRTVRKNFSLFGRKRRRRNPGILGETTGLVGKSMYTIIGAVGSRAICQMLLKSKNSGPLGFAANIAAGFGLSKLTEKFTKNKQAGDLVLLGSMIGVVLRALQEYTPIGSYVQSQLSGMGDLGMGIYRPTTFFTPGTQGDPNSVDGGAMTRLPASLQAAIDVAKVAQTRAASAGQGMGGRYGRAGRYR